MGLWSAGKCPELWQTCDKLPLKSDCLHTYRASLCLQSCHLFLLNLLFMCKGFWVGKHWWGKERAISCPNDSLEQVSCVCLKNEKDKPEIDDHITNRLPFLMSLNNRLPICNTKLRIFFARLHLLSITQFYTIRLGMFAISFYKRMFPFCGITLQYFNQ